MDGLPGPLWPVKLPPCHMNPGIIVWEEEPFYPNPFSSVLRAQDFGRWNFANSWKEMWPKGLQCQRIQWGWAWLQQVATGDRGVCKALIQHVYKTALCVIYFYWRWEDDLLVPLLYPVSFPHWEHQAPVPILLTTLCVLYTDVALGLASATSLERMPLSWTLVYCLV